MRLGFAPAGSRDASTAVAMAVRAEELGYDQVWVSEDYLERGAFSVAAGVAARTSRVRVGLGVINPWTRHVALTAMECAALDELSGGRLIVGLGASNARWMEGMLGFAFERPVRRLTEYASALRVLLAGAALDEPVGGQHVKASLSFTPLRTDVPIVLGVKGPVALREGAKVADGLMLSVLSSPAYIDWVAGQHPGIPLTAYALTSIAEKPSGTQAAKDLVKPRVATFLGVHGASRIAAAAGVPDDLGREFRRRLLAGDNAVDLVDDELLARVTLAGSADEVTNTISRFAHAGLDVLVAMDDGLTPPEQMVGRLAKIARHGHH
jgi:alkanesulfonate monooxygenase SsuD/methylene tetrahydromethanopterin reductase-like flavin-dependent oxidoreductase (luciferase family)